MSGSSGDFTLGGLSTDGLGAVIMTFRGATDALHDELLRIMTEEVETVAFLARARMTELFNNPGRMMEAVETQVEDATTHIDGTVLADGLPYLAAQEYGVTTRPHDIFPVNAKALRFAANGSVDFSGHNNSANGDFIFAKVVHHPGSVIPERSYMRYALAQRSRAIRERFAGAASAAVRGAL